ncbi:MAG: hypothetical protein ABL911_12775 [Gallionella sp.]
MTNQFFRQVILGAVFLISSCAILNVEAAVPIAINAYAIHSGGQIVYRYQILNNSSSVIYQVTLGSQESPLGVAEGGLPGAPWSLNQIYWDAEVPLPLPTSQCKPFAGMDCKVVLIPEHLPISSMMSMTGLENNLIPPPTVFSGAEHIRPGMLSSVAELYIPPANQSTGFLTASGTVYLLDNNTKNPDGSVMYKAEIPFTKLDVIAPTLRVTLTPATLTKAQRGKRVPITATVTVSDNYDPAPDIQLVSITANEVLSAGDVQGATLGTNDRSFSLVAAHKTKNTTARIYTITYSATDASGNKSLATATVSAL